MPGASSEPWRRSAERLAVGVLRMMLVLGPAKDAATVA